jgi:hypothetical protein
MREFTKQDFLDTLGILDKATGEIRTPKDTIEWATWYEVWDNRVVQQEKVAGFWVSTVFLAINSIFFNEDRAPLWFETMVFRDQVQHSLLGKAHGQWRYSTLEEARAGHEAIKAQVLSGEIGE